MARQTNAIELLRKDHRQVKAMFHRFENADEQEQEQLCRQMVDALKMHTRIEEEVFYPYIREASDRLDLIEEANVEHATAKQLIADLESGRDGVHRQAVVKVLGEYVGHHIQEEEEKIFPLVEKLGVDLEALGEELLEHRERRAAKRESRESEPAMNDAQAESARQSKGPTRSGGASRGNGSGEAALLRAPSDDESAPQAGESNVPEEGR